MLIDINKRTVIEDEWESILWSGNLIQVWIKWRDLMSTYVCSILRSLWL